MEMEIENRISFFLAFLEIGCLMAIFSEYTKIGIVVIALGGIAIKIQEEIVYRKNNFALWSEIKTEVAKFYFKCGIIMIVFATVITGTILTTASASGLFLVLIAMEKILQKELLIRVPCKIAFKFMKKFKFPSDRCLEIMKYKNCSRVVA